MTKVVVTGASGFLGGALISFLKGKNIDCIGVSRKKSSDFFAVDSYEDSPRGDVLVHLAESNNRLEAERGGAEFEAAAGKTFDGLLKKAYRHVIYASSAVLYGDCSMIPRKVADPIEATDAYTRMKITSEKLVLSSGGAVLRLSNLYGPRMSPDNVISHIINQSGLDSAISMHSLSPVRDFLWIEDAVSALYSIIKKGASGVFNIGSGRGTSIRELVRIVQSITKKKQDVIELCPLKESSNLILDIELTKKTLGWAPKTILEDGIRKLVETKIEKYVQK